MQCTCTLIKSNDYSRTIPELKQLLAIKIVVSVLNSKHFRFIYNPGLKMHRSNLSTNRTIRVLQREKESEERGRDDNQREGERERGKMNERAKLRIDRNTLKKSWKVLLSASSYITVIAFVGLNCIHLKSRLIAFENSRFC